MADWLSCFRHDPVAPLLEASNPAVSLLCRHHLLKEGTAELSQLQALPEVQKILRKQTPNGCWRSRSKQASEYPEVNYSLIETWKQLRFLVQQYHMDRSDPRIERAAEYVLSCQTEEGDIRGILANQYTMYYTGALLNLLIRAGFVEDSRIEEAFQWLLSTRQDDGGWLPGPLLDSAQEEVHVLSSGGGETIREWDRSRPFCINGTGMVLLGFAAHPAHRKTKEAIKAATLLKRSFFCANNHSSYKHPDNWLVFHFPYWWNDLVSALDSVSRIINAPEDEDVQRAVRWLIEHQEPDGLWNVHYSRIHKRSNSPKVKEQRLWVSLNICRVLRSLQLNPAG